MLEQYQKCINDRLSGRKRPANADVSNQTQVKKVRRQSSSEDALENVSYNESIKKTYEEKVSQAYVPNAFVKIYLVEKILEMP